MIRPAFRFLSASWILAASLSVALPSVAMAKAKPAADDAEPATPAKGKGKAAKPAAGETNAKAAAKDVKDSKSSKDTKNKPVQVGTYGDWGAFTAQGKGKTCYALAQPKDRLPATLKRDPAYVFISNRPGENVRSEVSIIMGFAMKDNSEATAEIGGTSFDLICKGSNAWVKNPAKEPEFIETLKKGSKLVVHATSLKGNATTDSYSLAGLGEALARVRKDCP